jgi:hypothetical protein
MLRSRYCCQFVTKFEFSRQIEKKIFNQFMKICPMGSELYHADRRADGRNSIGETRDIFPHIRRWEGGVKNRV